LCANRIIFRDLTHYSLYLYWQGVQAMDVRKSVGIAMKKFGVPKIIHTDKGKQFKVPDDVLLW